MKIKDLTTKDPIFSHHNEETGVWTHIAAARLATALDGKKEFIRPVTIDEKTYQLILTCNGVEQPCVERWKVRYLLNASDPFSLPLPIFIEWEDKHHTLADGNHRLCALYQLGVPRILVYLAPPDLWRQFEVELSPMAQAIVNMPGYMSGSYSHLRKKDD